MDNKVKVRRVKKRRKPGPISRVGNYDEYDYGSVFVVLESELQPDDVDYFTANNIEVPTSEDDFITKIAKKGRKDKVDEDVETINVDELVSKEPSVETEVINKKKNKRKKKKHKTASAKESSNEKSVKEKVCAPIKRSKSKIPQVDEPITKEVTLEDLIVPAPIGPPLSESLRTFVIPKIRKDDSVHVNPGDASPTIQTNTSPPNDCSDHDLSEKDDGHVNNSDDYLFHQNEDGTGGDLEWDDQCDNTIDDAAQGATSQDVEPSLPINDLACISSDIYEDRILGSKIARGCSIDRNSCEDREESTTSTALSPESECQSKETVDLNKATDLEKLILVMSEDHDEDCSSADINNTEEPPTNVQNPHVNHMEPDENHEDEPTVSDIDDLDIDLNEIYKVWIKEVTFDDSVTSKLSVEDQSTVLKFHKTCSKCPLVFCEKADYIKHVTTANVVTGHRLKYAFSGKVVCGECREEIDEQLLVGHMINQHFPTHRCNICGAKFVGQPRILNHVKSCHPDLKRSPSKDMTSKTKTYYDCQFNKCVSKWFKTLSAALEHVKSIHYPSKKVGASNKVETFRIKSPSPGVVDVREASLSPTKNMRSSVETSIPGINEGDARDVGSLKVKKIPKTVDDFRDTAREMLREIGGNDSSSDENDVQEIEVMNDRERNEEVNPVPDLTRSVLTSMSLNPVSIPKSPYSVTVPLATALNSKPTPATSTGHSPADLHPNPASTPRVAPECQQRRKPSIRCNSMAQQSSCDRNVAVKSQIPVRVHEPPLVMPPDLNKLSSEEVSKYKKQNPRVREHMVDILTHQYSKSVEVRATFIMLPYPPQTCTRCFQIFFSEANFAIHDPCYIQHYRSYACWICGHQYLWIHDLENHYRHLHCEPQFQCTLCNERFFLENNAIAHVQYHSVLTRHVCTFNKCNATFPDRPQLVDHMKAVHFDNLHWYHHCAECSSYFKSECDLVSHTKEFHPSIAVIPVPAVPTTSVAPTTSAVNKCLDHRPNATRDVDPQIPTSGQMFQCRFCSKKLKSAIGRDAHIKARH